MSPATLSPAWRCSLSCPRRILEPLPKAVLAAIVITAVLALMRLGRIALHHLLDDARAAGMEVEITGAPPQAQGPLRPRQRARCADPDRDQRAARPRRS